MSEEKKRVNDSQIEIQKVYKEPINLQESPGTFPYTRGVREDMYRGRLWTMRQYAG
jgi:methylmalonyl-CoA mutase N-terminal domain/subunit